MGDGKMTLRIVVMSDLHDDDRAGRLALDLEAFQQIGVDAEPGAAIGAEGGTAAR